MTRLEPPAHYDDERREVWAETVNRLTSSGRVFRADPEVLGTYVEAVRSHRQASRLLAQTNVMITRDGKVMENPALAIQRKSAESMARASKALGLDRVQPMETADSPQAHGALPSGKCGGTNRQGGPCGNAPGYKTTHPGFGNCHYHGGSSPNGRAHALNQQAEKLLYQYDAPPVTDPLIGLQRLAGRVAHAEEVIGEKVNALSSWRYEGHGSGEQLRAEVAMLERTMTHLGRLLVDIAKLNIEGRLATVREATAVMLEQALQAALASSGCDLDGQQRAQEAFRRNLKVVA